MIFEGQSRSPRSRESRKSRVIVTASVPGKSKIIARRTGPASFPRGARLLRHADFERVYKQGRRHFSASMSVFYLRRDPTDARTPPANGFRIGFTVGRALGGAVQRNRMKRRLREAVRLNRPWPEVNADVVINPKKSLLTNDFAAVVNEVRQSFVAIDQKLAGRKELEGKPASRRPEAASR
jgi:ribonuclease P protein component